MRRPLLLAAVALAALAFPVASLAGEPPNQNDPCSRGGRDVCNTAGVGFYDTYRYGVRWFGDFRGSIPGEKHTFCIDLRYWYPSRAYPYKEITNDTLRNRDGQEVRLVNRQKLAYAMWAYGRSSSPNRQAAVMLYVHGLMGDAEPGEVDPATIGNAAVSAWYAKVADDAERYHGPYRIETSFPDSLSVGQRAVARIRVLSAAGNALPNADLALSAGGAAGLPHSVQTNANGVANVAVTVRRAGQLEIDVRTLQAATLPRVFIPTKPVAARNGQRLAAPSSELVKTAISATVGMIRIKATTAVAPQSTVVGQAVRDTVRITGALNSWHGTVAVRIYGPFRTASQIRCTGKPAWKGSFPAAGPGVYRTTSVKVPLPGLYTYQEIIPGDASHLGFLTPCRDPAERFKVDVRPDVRTIVSAQKTTPGTAINDRVRVEGLLGEQVTVAAALYGPFGSRAAISCSGKPVWTGTIDVAKDGEYATAPVTLRVPGYYTYRESIAAGPFVRAVQTVCAETSETAVVTGTPRVRTRVSTKLTTPGKKITDKVVVSGVGVLNVKVNVSLYGPFLREGAVRCTGTPYWKGSFVAKGDGTYRTAPAKLDRVGYYTYQESIAASEATSATTTKCADAAETMFAFGDATVTTIVSKDTVLPGARIYDRIRVSGLGKSRAVIEVELFGPFASRASIRCGGKPYWQGRVLARGDGEVRSPSVKIAQVGFYTYREHLVGSDLIGEVTTECGVEAETSLARPLVLTGRGDATARAPGKAAAGRRPTRIELPSLGIDAAVGPVIIDLGTGALGVPRNIHRTGWWRDGASPGDGKGAVLISGHVDSAKAGAGAFNALKRAQVGDRAQVRTANGRTFTYRVVSVRTYRKRSLPADIYSLRGRERLVLVTCGGPFNAAIGHYRDNIVVTAVRVRG